MPRPLLYEINTRCWLRGLSDRAGRSIHLGNVPEAEFAFWKRMGFTHVWLMGVWTTGPRSRERYLQSPDTPARLNQALPDWHDEDVAGSPYAIAEYRVPDTLGGERGLQQFRGHLHEHGIGLLLDFVPNHFGVDHPWTTQRPELFVTSPSQVPETFQQDTIRGRRWIAHGKDPFFAAWNDTAQLDHRRADTRAAMLEELRAVAARCDGVRCDMAMLVLNDIFARTWEKFPRVDAASDSGEFWADAITAVKRPGFLFVAEAYWDLEPRLQSLGFDYTYNKRVPDCIVERRWPELQEYLLGLGNEILQHSVHFLENHDEPRIAGRLSPAEHRAAALLVLALPGMCLLHEGQLTGARTRVPVQLRRRPCEPADHDVQSLYTRLLETLPRTAVGRGHGQVLRPWRVSAEDDSAKYIIAVYWQEDGAGFDLVAVNPSPDAARCRILPPRAGLEGRQIRVSDILDGRNQSRLLDCSAGRGFLVELPAHSAALLHCSHV
jgi:hypothetical protein